jgi:hypothetical protein
LFSIFEDRRHPVAQVGRSFGEGEAALQQEAADLVDGRGASMCRGLFAQEAPATPAEDRRALETIILCAGVVQSFRPPITRTTGLS